jgi:excisionase family DNA binding protein
MSLVNQACSFFAGGPKSTCFGSMTEMDTIDTEDQIAMSKIQKFCRTFPDANESHEPCSIATRIELHRGLLTPDQLAELLAVSRKSIYAWAKQGRLPSVTLGASVRFDPYDTAVWVRARTA